MERGDYVRVKSFKGCACVYLGPGREFVVPECQGHEPDLDDPRQEQGETFYCDGSCEEGEWVEYEDLARVRMVGDDQVHEVTTDECSPLDDDDFCADCGQLGCSHGRYNN